MPLDKLPPEVTEDSLGATVVAIKLDKLIDNGLVFYGSVKATGLTNGSTYDLLISVPSGYNMHLLKMRSNVGEGDVDIEMYEGTTTSADGSAGTPVDVNRVTANTANVGFYTGPTVTDAGTLIHTGWAVPTATGTGLSSAGVSNTEAGEEWVLKANTKYLYRITNNSGATIDHWHEGLWYEETA